MTDEFKERIFQGVRRMVIWGESRADILHRLEVNGITGDEALRMYERAHAERVSIIKTGAIKQAMMGLGLLLAAAFLFNRLFSGSAGISRYGVSAPHVHRASGPLAFFKGLFGCLQARFKEGSLADEEDDGD